MALRLIPVIQMLNRAPPKNRGDRQKVLARTKNAVVLVPRARKSRAPQPRRSLHQNDASSVEVREAVAVAKIAVAMTAVAKVAPASHSLKNERQKTKIKKAPLLTGLFYYTSIICNHTLIRAS